MKNIFRKNQVIITALAIMIAVAGYLNFTGDKVAKQSDDMDNYVAADSTSAIDETTGVDTDSLVTSADLANEDLLAALNGENSSDVESLTDASDLLDPDLADSTLDISDEDVAANDGSIEVADNGELVVDNEDDQTESKDTTGEAVLVNNPINSSYFTTAKLKREQTRTKNREDLMELIDNENVTEEQKQEATNKILEMTANAEKETLTESLLGAKGFSDVVVDIVDGSVDVIVNVTNMTDQQRAQIEDIVKNKTGISVENITITPVEVN